MNAENTLTVRLVECAKTAAQWAALLTIPKRGEICLEMENQGTNENPDLLFKMKIGDGIHTYANLNYFPVDANIAQVVASWVEQNLDVNEYAQASYDDMKKKLSIYGIKEVDGKIVKGTNHVDIQLAEGTKIDITSDAGVITIAHEATTRTDTTKSSAGYGTNVVTDVTTDQTGHVTGVETAPLPTKPATKNVIGASAAATVDGASANPYLNHIEDGDVKSHHQLIGGTQVDVNSDASGNVTIKHETITRSDAEESAQPTNLVTEITTANGHVTGAKTINPDDLIVGIAKDLDAPVVRSDNSMWNHRVTGGTINIGEETAKISKLRGNTLVWNQQIQNGDFSNGLTSWNGRGSTSYISVSNGVCTVLYDGSTSSPTLFQNNAAIVQGHRYLFACKVVNTNTIIRLCLLSSSYSVGEYTDFSASSTGNISTILTCSDSTYNRVSVTTYNVTTGSSFSVTNVKFIDLTKLFGSDFAIEKVLLGLTTEVAWSNLTADQLTLAAKAFENLFPNFYYPYKEGELLSLKPTGVKSVGFNLWDEEWDVGAIRGSNGTNDDSVTNTIRSKNYIQVFPNTTYYVRSATTLSCRRRFYDANKNFLGEATIFETNTNQVFTTPVGAYFMRFYMEAAYGVTYNHDICINLSDPSRNGTYEPYKESTLDLSWIKSIKDSDGNLLFPDGELHSAGSVYDEVGDSYAVKRIRSRNYTSTDDDDSTVITDGTTTYYPLAEPVTVYFDKKPMTYPVDDLGTETLLPEGVDSTTGVPLSAPFNGTFEYKSNFKDAVIDLINAVNNYKNPVRGKDNSDQTVGQLAEYDSDSTVKASGYKASNATISPTGSDNASILPTVAALIAYVQGVAQNALHYQGTVATVASLPSTGTTTGDVYILSATDGDYDAGDWFIRNNANTGWDVVQGRVRVTNRAATLTPDGGTKNIANVEGTEITVVMPDLNFAEPTASGETLTVVDNISQTNGKILATKKNVQSASKSQKGVVQFVTDIHGSSDQTKGVTAADAWTEFGKRNVKAVEVDTVDSIETSSTTQEVIAEGLADLDARVLGIEASIKNGFTSLEVGELVVGYALFARIRRGDFILKGAGAPSASVVPVDWNEEKYGEWTGIPLYEGQIYIDTTNKIAYMAVGVSAVTDWKRITNA